MTASYPDQVQSQIEVFGCESQAIFSQPRDRAPFFSYFFIEKKTTTATAKYIWPSIFQKAYLINLCGRQIDVIFDVRLSKSDDVFPAVLFFLVLKTIQPSWQKRFKVDSVLPALTGRRHCDKSIIGKTILGQNSHPSCLKEMLKICHSCSINRMPFQGHCIKKSHRKIHWKDVKCVKIIHSWNGNVKWSHSGLKTWNKFKHVKSL